MTYSIVARDPETGALGAAVQSHYFGVRVAIRVEDGVGAVASQSFLEPSYFLGLDLMRGGLSAPDALKALVTVEPGEARRQVAMVDTSGRVAAHTGSMCIAHAGHRTGEGCSVQANMMLRDTVPDAMLAAYEHTDGDLTDRLLAALDAAEAEGGDVRGRQSSAIVTTSGVDLRVEDHPEPLAELRRLVGLRRAYDRFGSGLQLAMSGDVEAGIAEIEAARALAPDKIEMTFFQGVVAATAGHADEARALLRQASERYDGWSALLERLPAAGLLDAAALDRHDA